MQNGGLYLVNDSVDLNSSGLIHAALQYIKIVRIQPILEYDPV